MRTRARHVHEGSSLLEVVVALAFVALAMVGAVASQLQALSLERSTAQRERALVIATSIVEAMRDPRSGSHALPRWQAYAAAALPAGEILIVDRAPGVALAVVRWAAPRIDRGRPLSTPDDCAGEATTADLACVAVPFVREAGHA